MWPPLWLAALDTILRNIVDIMGQKVLMAAVVDTSSTVCVVSCVSLKLGCTDRTGNLVSACTRKLCSRAQLHDQFELAIPGTTEKRLVEFEVFRGGTLGSQKVSHCSEGAWLRLFLPYLGGYRASYESDIPSVATQEVL